MVAQIAEEQDEMGHAMKHLDKHGRMIKTKCEQITETQSLILYQTSLNNIIRTIVVTRGGKETQGPKGPDLYEEEQSQKRREIHEQSQ
jgi:hypothetical protein